MLNVAGESVRAIRLSFVGELGWELHIPDASAVKVYRALMQAGAEYGIVNAGYRAIDNLSIEKGGCSREMVTLTLSVRGPSLCVKI